MTALPHEKYLSSDYVNDNPTWDSEDSPWKAALVRDIFTRAGVAPNSVCEIGCGAGGVLAHLRRCYPDAELFGFDIAPAAASFWPQHADAGVTFRLGDFFEESERNYDAILLLDVVEHLTDPFTFLTRLRGRAEHYAFILPLDLSALSLLRERPILRQRAEVGHIHYFTKNLALALLRDCGYDVVAWRYSGAAFDAPRQTWKTKLGAIPRALAYAVNKELGVRAMGGETLVVLAR